MLAAVAIIGLALGSCTSSSDEDESIGSIYGIVTKKRTSEIVEGISIYLYKLSSQDKDPVYKGNYSLLLTTTTFSDGHFEFSNLTPGHYYIKGGAYYPYALKYEYEEYVLVEVGRQSRIDISIN